MNTFSTLKTIRDYGNPPAYLRLLVYRLKRQGVGHRKAVRAVKVINAYVAGQRYERERREEEESHVE